MRRLLALLLALLAAPAFAADFRMEVVQLVADPPGAAREAPGGGRVLTPGLLFTPSAGRDPYGPAIVMLDSGPGAHPLEAGEASRFAAERLASRGYTVLSLYGHQERGFPTIKFADTVWTVKAALDWLEAAGHERFALAGQGYGAIVAAQYLATQPDVLLDNGGDKRVRGLLLIDPLTDVRGFARLDFGPAGYEAKVAAARATVAAGRGLYPEGALVPGAAGIEPWVGAGAFTQPAEAFLALWGPEAQTRNAALLAKVTLPALALVSDARSTSPTFRTGGSVDVVRFKGENYVGSEEAASKAIAGWLARHDLGVPPRVATTTLDVVSGGRRLQGVRYSPPVVDPARPTIILLSGRAADTVQASTHWMGWRLAQRGYDVIAIGMRISGASGFATSTLAEVAEDVGHWVDRAEAVGARRIVLAGHSNGGIWLSNYLAVSHDRRVVGTVYYAPTRDSPAYARAHMPPGEYEATVTAARAAVAAGRDLDYVAGFLTARAFLDNNGPDARTVHTARVREFDLPGLSITGANDPLMSDAFVAEFARAYRGRLTQFRYPNGSHGLRESKDRAMDDTAAWLARTFP